MPPGALLRNGDGATDAEEVLILRRHLVTKITTAAALTAGLGIATVGTQAAYASDRVSVCAKQLKLTLEPNQGWQGTLRDGESFAVRKHSDSGKYAYGLAYGHINRLGWVRTAGLCGSDGKASGALAGQRVRICADRLKVTREPNQGWQGTLHDGQSLSVRKLSDSGKYAYGLAYGHINRLGWVLTKGLCTGGATG